MSILSKISGIHISKHGVHIEPLKALGTVATLGSLGALGPVGAALRAIPGAGAVASGVSKVGGALKAIPGASQIGNAITGGNGLSGAVSKVGGFLKDHGDQLLGAGSLYEGYKANQKSNDLMNEALASAKGSYAERAPLRTAGVQGLLNQQRPDLSSVYANPSNPYSRVRVG